MNAKDGGGYTALMFAVQAENEKEYKIVEILIGRKADVNAQDEEGYSILRRQQSEGKTALEHAEGEEHNDVIKLLQ
ncbi:MAG: ankyrin repeat domain-containing protein [Thiovulaceae bacterium]|nr:ankyrin repeat domain-containing protein [Sulfurimonadaceae bacterium]